MKKRRSRLLLTRSTPTSSLSSLSPTFSDPRAVVIVPSTPSPPRVQMFDESEGWIRRRPHGENGDVSSASRPESREQEVIVLDDWPCSSHPLEEEEEDNESPIVTKKRRKKKVPLVLEEEEEEDINLFYQNHNWSPSKTIQGQREVVSTPPTPKLEKQPQRWEAAKPDDVMVSMGDMKSTLRAASVDPSLLSDEDVQLQYALLISADSNDDNVLAKAKSCSLASDLRSPQLESPFESTSPAFKPKKRLVRHPQAKPRRATQKRRKLRQSFAESDSESSQDLSKGTNEESGSDLGVDDICQKCGHGGDLILCDGCDGAFHLYCLSPPLSRAPAGDWYCPLCAESRMLSRRGRKSALDTTQTQIRPNKRETSSQNASRFRKRQDFITFDSSEEEEQDFEDEDYRTSKKPVDEIDKQMKKWIGVSNRLRGILRKWGGGETSSVDHESVPRSSSQRVNLTRVGDSTLTQPAFLAEGLALKDYQMVGVAYLGLLHGLKMNSILADEMGLGKTVQSIIHLANVKAKESRLPHLIVVPASTLENWNRELKMWTPFLRVELLHGPKKEREILLKKLNKSWFITEFDIILTTYSVVVNDRKMVRKIGFNYMVLDEAHCIKNSQSARHQALAGLKFKRILLLTGTPIQNNIEEVVGLTSFLLPGSRGDLVRLFNGTNEEESDGESDDSDGVQKRKKAVVVLDDSERLRRVKNILGPFILRRLKSEVLDEMVPKLIELLRVPMIPDQRKLYNEVLATSKSKISANSPSSDSAVSSTETSKSSSKSTSKYAPKTAGGVVGNIIMQLRKAANHPLLLRRLFSDTVLVEISEKLIDRGVYEERQRSMLWDHLTSLSDHQLHELCSDYRHLQHLKLDRTCFQESNKVQRLRVLLKDLKQNGHRVLLFSQFTIVLDILQEAIWDWDETYEFLRLDGSTPIAERQQMCDSFNQPDSPYYLFLISTRAGGLGLNLATADTIITFDLDWNPHNDRQSEDRAHRIGQTKPVTVYRMLSEGSIEEQIYKMAQRKRKLDQDILAGNGDEDESRNSSDLKVEDAVSILGDLLKAPS